MNLIKKIAFTLFAFFLAYQVYFFVETLIRSDPNTFSVSLHFIFAFLLSLFITGVFAFLGFIYPTHKFLSNTYYEIQNPVRLKKIYVFAQVDLFRKALLLFFWGSRKNRKKYFNGTRQGIRNFIYQTKQSEFGHLAAFIVTLIACVMLLYFNYYWLVIFAFLINILGNAYPVILQRYHRIRIGKLFK
ncbi:MULTISPECIES: hypothetical protein [unclassified Leeuwenhoekiella]|uniref:glycosyl-4,4'-diaponeurosporenoate acyltransferase CrtO family protein n=1 Tax=unclassified Leeuwenhoekiella TaxID=2615029 RepID=UPI000C6628D2|nr:MULTISPECIES: hypothetical protein [unclassified Leeuwenhoekiella]MAW94012.1 hypothetical protein [Leeuwenhoekiella sp.]MBA80949.1 hypothetical protein [Leeuwenhoekiella sp.]|tara:strand:- start:3262 stop:3822 length:561 start_codon:yes stop_codon:yes gene_type:complete